MQISNIRYGHAYQIKLLLLLPEKGSRRESAQILSLRFLILKLLLSVDMVSRTIVGVQHTTLEEFPYFYSFIYLFLPGGIIAFSHNWKSESGIVYARDMWFIKWKTTPEKSLYRVKGRLIASG